MTSKYIALDGGMVMEAFTEGIHSVTTSECKTPDSTATSGILQTGYLCRGMSVASVFRSYRSESLPDAQTSRIFNEQAFK
ncbi:hypothetical protein [Nitrosomonas ureae]|uniref:hypothetical protein n=1 Tax=Nitrosomonas ureae TaxID=44577 RepID=UPI000D30B23F|nr:hypothetical protein [Nitrosomonas ureae]